MRELRILLGAVTVSAAAACVNPNALGISPSGNPEMRGRAVDDAGLKPGGSQNRALAGVRLQLVDGPRAGTVAISDAEGNYSLPSAGSGPLTVTATKDGFDPQTDVAYPEYGTAPIFVLGRPPHTVWGQIALAFSTPPVPVPQVRLEILDGPNAGKVTVGDDDGYYRFDDLVASDTTTVRLSKEGYQSRTYRILGLWHSQQNNYQIEPE